MAEMAGVRSRRDRASMSVHVSSRFRRESVAELGARLVGLIMAEVAGDDGICWASQARLIEESRLSERGVRDALRKLEEIGEIETRIAQRGRRRINVYRLWCSDEPDYDRLPFEVDRPFQVRPAESAGRQEGDDRQSTTRRPASGGRGRCKVRIFRPRSRRPLSRSQPPHP